MIIDKDQWSLFHVFLTSNIRIDGPELGEVVAAQLEGTIYEPGLGFAEELKLLFFFGGKDKMASSVYSYICGMCSSSNYWVFRSGVLCKPICSLCQ